MQHVAPTRDKREVGAHSGQQCTVLYCCIDAVVAVRGTVQTQCCQIPCGERVSNFNCRHETLSAFCPSYIRQVPRTKTYKNLYKLCGGLLLHHVLVEQQ